MSGIKVQAYGEAPPVHFPTATSWLIQPDGSLDVIAVTHPKSGGELSTVVATFATQSWLMVQTVQGEPVKLIPDVPNADRIGHSAYESCVLGAWRPMHAIRPRPQR